MYLGKIRVEDYPARLDQVLQTAPPPPRQRAFNPKKMRTEQIKPDGSFYVPNEQTPPYIKCTERTEQRAIPALHSYQLLHDNLQQAPLGPGSAPVSIGRTAKVTNEAGMANTGWTWDEEHKRYRYWDGQKWAWQG